MSTDPSQERTLGQLVASATSDISTIVRSEIALAKSELSSQAKKAGKGGAFLAVAAVIGFYAVYFIFTTLAQVIAIWLPLWAGYLIVTVFMLAVAGLFAMLGVKRLKTVNPSPTAAVAEANQTVAAVKAALANPGTMPPAPRPEWDRPTTNVPGPTPAATSTGPTAPVPTAGTEASGSTGPAGPNA